MSQAQKQVQKRDYEIPNFRIKWLFGVDAGGCADKPWAVLLHMCSGFPTKMVEQMFVTSLNDVTRISHALEGGNYKRGVQLGSRSSAAAITVVWVFQHKF